MITYVVNKFFSSVTYIIPVGISKECWLIDCGDTEEVFKQGWKVRGVLLTHVHADHIYGLNILIEWFPQALIYTNEFGKMALLNPRLNYSKYHDNVDNFIFGKPNNINLIHQEGLIKLDDDFVVDVLFTPGHDPSCISYHINDMLFTGDSYIPGIKTVLTLPRSNRIDGQKSVERLMMLEKKGLKVYPGHYIMG